MIRHIVMIKFKDPLAKDKESLKLKMMLEDLEDQIPSLIKMEVGINLSTKSSAFDLVLTADFENEIALDAYRIHPAHVKVFEYLKNVVAKSAVVDYSL